MIMARSKAGHDKGRLYYVLDEDEKSVRLADGKSRKVDTPKVKSKKHIQPIYRLPDDIERERAGIMTLTNEKIAHLLKKYETTFKEDLCQKQM